MNYKNIISKVIIELKKAGSQSAEIDVSVILKYILEKDDVWILSHNNVLLTNSQYQKFRRLIRRRKRGEPIAYLTGHKEFNGLDFIVNKNVLIPRPETEALVENVLEFIKFRLKADRPLDEKVHKVYKVKNLERINKLSNHPITTIDIGTGSGCIIISLAKEILKKTIIHDSSFMIQFYASDISKKALIVAKNNAKLHSVNNQIKFYHSDLFSNPKMPKKYDVIISNLPYVPKINSKIKMQNAKLLNKNNILYEPQTAIFADDNGMKIIKKFLEQAKERINNQGLIIFEVDPRNAKDLFKYSKIIFPKASQELIKDYSQKNRVIKILT